MTQTTPTAMSTPRYPERFKDARGARSHRGAAPPARRGADDLRKATEHSQPQRGIPIDKIEQPAVTGTLLRTSSGSGTQPQSPLTSPTEPTKMITTSLPRRGPRKPHHHRWSFPKFQLQWQRLRRGRAHAGRCLVRDSKNAAGPALAAIEWLIRARGTARGSAHHERSPKVSRDRATLHRHSSLSTIKLAVRH